jgi:choice-of-anchor B domain-containing protein
MGVYEGVAVIRVADLEVIDIISGPQQNDYWYHRDIKTYGHYAYITNEMYGTNEGLMILDLQYLPDSVRFVGSYDISPDLRSHNLSIDVATGFAYIEESNGWLILDLADPENPVDVGIISAPGHDIMVRNDTAYVAEGWGSIFSIWDVTSKAHPQELVSIASPSNGYLHNIWPTEDGNYVLTTEETDNRTVKIWDISDLNNVNLVAEYLAPNDLAHNVHVEGDYAFISHYTSGVAVLDIHDPTNPVEVAVYDTYVPNDDPQFAGCWGVYPHTSNGMVFTSNIEGYLNIFQFHDIETDVNEETALTGEFVLNQNYPNPFNPITTLRYKIPEKQTVSLSIFDLSGRLVETIFDDQLEPGTFKILWNASAHSSGVYFAILENGKNRIVQKLILLK